MKLSLRVLPVWWIVFLPAIAAAGSPAVPPVRPPDTLPAAWTRATPVWKPTWDETLAANPEAEWQKAIVADPALARAAPQIASLRQIALLRAMMQRFPGDKERHVEAYREIARRYGALGSPWRRSAWLWKLTRAFPQRKDLMAEAFRQIMALPFASAAEHPSARDWAFALHEVLRLNDAGVIPDAHPVVPEAYRHLGRLLAGDLRYDAFQDFLRRVERAGRRNRAVHTAAGDLLRHFGHWKRADACYEKAGRKHAVPIGVEPAVGGLPRDVDLEIRWEALHLGGDRPDFRGVHPEDLQKILDAGAESGAFVREGPAHALSAWAALDAALAGSQSETLAALREAQDRAVGGRARMLREDPDGGALLRLFRRYPWAAAVHEALMASGERALRAGRNQWAAASFRDVLRHAADPGMRAQAQAGLRLAAAAGGDTDGAAPAVPDGTKLRWRGAPTTAGALRKTLSAQAKAAPPRPLRLADVSLRRAGPGDPSPEAPSLRRDGKAWDGMRPIGRPTVADGRAYVPAASAEAENPMLSLVCADPRDGRVLWTRPLGRSGAAPRAGTEAGGVTVAGGAVYGCTHAGIVARCDARDGCVAWVRAYARAFPRPPRRPPAGRPGTAPIVTGGRVLVAPGDHTGVLAFDRATGRLLWESVLVPSDRLVGVVGELLVTLHPRRLAALEVATGRMRWCRAFEEDTNGRAIVRGRDVIVLAGGTLVRVAADTGKTVEERRLGWDGVVERRLLPDGTLLEAAAPGRPPGKRVPNAGAPLRLPLREVWALSRERPTPVFAADTEGNPGRFWVLSGRGLACVRTRPAWETVWERGLPAQPEGAFAAGNRVFLRWERTLTAVDGTSGKTLWSARLRFHPFALDGDAARLFAASRPGRWEPCAAALDAATGRTLWERSFEEIGFGGGRGLEGMIARGTGGGVRLRLYGRGLFGDTPGPWAPAEAVVDAGTGAIREIRRALPGENAWPGYRAFTPGGIAWVGGGYRAGTTGPDGRAAAWKQKVDFSAFYKVRSYVRLQVTAAGPYIAVAGRVYHFDRAAGKAVVYPLPPGGERTFYNTYDLRETGPALAVVSGLKGKYIHTKRRWRSSIWYQPVTPRVYADLFDRRSGRHLGRQALPGVACTRTPKYDGDLRVKILPDAVVVADDKGLRVFAAAAGAAPAPPKK